MSHRNWTAEENTTIVADYFSMLADEEAERPYNKAAHNRKVMDQIDRSRGSIEFKHQNISAILKALGENWITGYKPAFNFQITLADAVAIWIAKHQSWAARLPKSINSPGLGEFGTLWIAPAPTMANTPPPDEAQKLAEIALKFDVAAQQAQNKALGRVGEKLALAHEKKVLRDAGKPDLARAVRWISEEDGDGAGYDIQSFTPEGDTRLIEVKTTKGWERTPFYISQNELAVAERNPNDWLLLRVWNLSKTPRAFELRPPLSQHVELMPTSFKASFRQR